MSIHVAIMMRPYLQMILDGRKAIESRLTVRPLVPFNVIKPGERIFFKASSGPFMATAIAEEIFFFDALTPAKVAALHKRFNKEVCGDAQFWEWKKDSKYATFTRLTKVQPISVGPRMAPSNGPAWFVLPDEAAPPVPVMFEVMLTAGALKNHYLRIAKKTHEFAARHYGGKTQAEAGEPITLILPDGGTVATDIVSNHMLRWRGWKDVYAAASAKAGDVVRFVQVDERRYRVTLVSGRAESSRPTRS
ncbi:MAG: ASCH domain-containing protein [Phycisphaeraceae bacterium]